VTGTGAVSSAGTDWESHRMGSHGWMVAVRGVRKRVRRIRPRDWLARRLYRAQGRAAQHAAAFPGPSGKTAGGVNANASKQELLERPRPLGVRGRSSMSKGELVDALRRTSDRQTPAGPRARYELIIGGWLRV
jgi:hypothetical protein